MKKFFTSIVSLLFLVNLANAQCTISVNPSSPQICAGDCVTLHASGADTYQWMPGGLTDSVVHVCPTTTTAYTVSGTDALSQTCSASVTIYVNPVPMLNASATSTNICNGSCTSLSVNGGLPGTLYNWMPGNLGGAPVPVCPASTTTYTVTGSFGNCTSSASITITVNPKPIITATALPTNVCAGTPSTITASSNIAGTTFVWTPFNLPGSTISVTPIATTTYTITGTSPAGCTGSNTVTVTVNTTPVLNPVATPNPICRGDNSSLCITPEANTNYVWIPGGLSGSCLPVHPVATTTYTVTGTNTISGCTASATVTLVVNQKPVFTVTATPTATCVGGTSTLSANCSANCTGVTYLWMPGSLGDPSINVHPVVSTCYTVMATNAYGCIASANPCLTVNPKPNITPTATPASICSGDFSNLSATSSVVGTTYVWMPGGSPGIPVSVIPATTTTYTVSGTSPFGCTGTATVTVTVSPVDNPAFNYSPSTLCMTGPDVAATITGGSSGTFSAVPIGLVFLNTATGLIDVSTSAINTYTITFTTNGPNSCHSSSTAAVTITPAPSATFSYAGPYCTNGVDPFPTFATGASGGIFSAVPAGLVFLSTATGQVDVSASAPGTYTVTNMIAAGGGCGATSSTSTITINAAVTPTFNPVPAICAGGALAALPTTSNNGITGTWLPFLNNTQTTTYHFTPTTGMCANAATLTVTVNPVLSPTINCGVSTSSSASFNWAAVAGATGYNVNYQVNAGAVVMVGPIGNVMTYGVNGLSAGDSVTITVTPTGGYGTCFTYSTNTCTAIPCAPPTANISYATPICAGSGTQSVSLSGTGAYTGGTFNCGPAGLSIDASTGSITPSTSLAGTYSVSYSVAGVGGCPGVTATTQVTISPVITPTFTQIGPLCLSQVPPFLPLSSINIPPIYGTWDAVISTSTLGNTVYTFTPAYGQCATSATMTINITSQITPTFTPVGPICYGAALGALPTLSTNGISGSWAPLIDNTATTTYTFTPNVGPCATSTTLTITVNPVLSPTINCGVATSSSVSVYWAAVAGATGYSVSYQVYSAAVVNVGPIGNLLSYNVSGLTSGDSVDIHVAPTGGTGNCFASSTTSCAVPSHGIYDVSGSTSCHLPYLAILDIYDNFVWSIDTVNYHLDFGDGSDTLFSMMYNNIPHPMASVTHIYDALGTYSPSAILQHTNGLADTIYAPNLIVTSGSCGDISGRVFVDMNSNCVSDSGEILMSNKLIKLFDQSHHMIQAQFTDSHGFYSFNVPNGIYSVEIDSSIYANYTLYCPAGGSYSIPGIPATNKDFGLNFTPGFDLYGQMGATGFRPNKVSYLFLTIGNYSSVLTNAYVKLVLDPLTTYNISNLTSPTINGDTISWVANNLSASGTAHQYFTVGVYTSPLAVINDSLSFSLTVSPITGDVNPLNNLVNKKFRITNSYDPNEKEVSPAGDITANTDLTYTLHFQNTGNAEALNIYLLDTLDDHLDLNTLILLGSSHNYSAQMLQANSKNILKFLFPNIMLPDSGSNQMLSHGYISYQIIPLSNSPDGSIINNTADIYFDFNAAITTNTVQNVIPLYTLLEETGNDPSPIDRLYPNPADQQATITYYLTEKGETSIEVFDITGKRTMTLLHQELEPGVHQLTFTVKDMNPGIYFIRINGNNHLSVLKLVKIGW